MGEAALAAHRAGAVRVAIGRGSDFFGPWAVDSAFGGRVFYPALEGKAASFGGKLDLPKPATYIGDFGRALVILGERDEAPGRAWHVPNDRPEITQRQFAELLFRETGRPVKAGGVRKPMMALAGLFIPGARESVEMANCQFALLHPKSARVDKLLRHAYSSYRRAAHRHKRIPADAP
jgi:nucleoside-diphosphate-sugar epimerase